MTYKFEKLKLKINSVDDKRIKLSNEDRKEIIKLYPRLSQRELARRYNVSRSLIRWTLFPDKLKHNREIRVNSKYYNKEKHRSYIKKYRNRKQSLYLKDRLI